MRRTTELNVLGAKIGNSPAVFKVRNGSRLVGTLSVSRGGLRWYPRGCSIARMVTWRRLGNMLKEI